VGKSQTFSKYPNNSGIYKITNTINQHIYVGSTKCFRDRWWQHFYQLCNGIHDNPHLQAAFLKYGKEAFEFSVLQEVEPENDDLKAAEQKFLDELNPEYNICTFADRPESISEWWVLFSPQNEDFLVYNFADFCRQNSLNYEEMAYMPVPHVRHVNGWYCRKAREDEISVGEVLYYWRPDPEGDEEGVWWNAMNNRWLVYVYPQSYDTPYRAGWFDTQEEAEKQLELLASLSSEDFYCWQLNGSKPKHKFSGYKGVYPSGRRWKALIYPNPQNLQRIIADPWFASMRIKEVPDYFLDSRQVVEIGIFDTPEEAATAYNQVLIRLFGETNAKLNVIEPKLERHHTWEDKMKSFFNSGSENREFITYLAYRRRIAWNYRGVSLEEAVNYLNIKKILTETYRITLDLRQRAADRQKTRCVPLSNEW
jgi:hypothetical protein